MFFEHTAWLPDNTLLALESSNEEWGIARIRDAETIETVAIVVPRDESLTVAHAFRITPDGKTAAILIRDDRATYWWIPRSRD